MRIPPARRCRRPLTTLDHRLQLPKTLATSPSAGLRQLNQLSKKIPFGGMAIMEFPDYNLIALVFGCLSAVGVVLSVMTEWKVISAMAQQGALARPSAPNNSFPRVPPAARFAPHLRQLGTFAAAPGRKSRHQDPATHILRRHCKRVFHYVSARERSLFLLDVARAQIRAADWNPAVALQRTRC